MKFFKDALAAYRNEQNAEKKQESTLRIEHKKQTRNDFNEFKSNATPYTVVMLTQCANNVGSWFADDIRVHPAENKSYRSNTRKVKKLENRGGKSKTTEKSKEIIGEILLEPTATGCPYCSNQERFLCDCGNNHCFPAKSKIYKCPSCNNSGIAKSTDILKNFANSGNRREKPLSDNSKKQKSLPSSPKNGSSSQRLLGKN